MSAPALPIATASVKTCWYAGRSGDYITRGLSRRRVVLCKRDDRWASEGYCSRCMKRKPADDD
jgi:hypothetical protein